MKRHTLSRCLAFLGAMALIPALPLAFTAGNPAPASALFPGRTGFAFRLQAEKAAVSSPNTLPAESSSLAEPPEPQLSEPVPPEPPTGQAALPESNVSLPLPSAYRVLDTQTGEVLFLSPFDYICGVTAAEAPISFQPEALKAQAVAAHSYALCQMGLQLQNPDPSLRGAYLSTDPAHFQAYLSREERQELWGDSFEQNEEKLETAVREVIGKILVCGEEPAAAAFHSISSGRTESAADVWGQEIPYLVAVDSPEDAGNPKMSATLTITVQETAATLSANLDSLSLPEDPAKWFAVKERTPSGMVKKVQVGESTLDGETFRAIFGLDSANFSISYDGENFQITTKGRGHGVGMSQYGADAMAQSGSSWEEILARYYPGAGIASVGS